MIIHRLHVDSMEMGGKLSEASTTSHQCNNFDFISILEFAVGVFCSGNEFAISFNSEKFRILVQLPQKIGHARTDVDGMFFSVDLDCEHRLDLLFQRRRT